MHNGIIKPKRRQLEGLVNGKENSTLKCGSNDFDVENSGNNIHDFLGQTRCLGILSFFFQKTNRPNVAENGQGNTQL